MIAIKIYKNNKFIGYFSFESFDYKLKHNFNTKIPNYTKLDYQIKNFRPLKNNLYLFENEDLYNNVINSHLQELIELFKNHEWYKNYTYKLCYIYETPINSEKYEENI